jgi:hypothetical protein
MNFWRASVNKTQVFIQSNLPYLAEFASVDILFNNPIVSGALPAAVSVELSNDQSTWTSVLFFAQNCNTYVGVPSGVTCISFGSIRSLSGSIASSNYPTASYFRLRLFPATNTASVEVECLDCCDER